MQSTYFECLADQFKQITLLPALPETALRLMSTLKDADKGGLEIDRLLVERIMSDDPELAAHFITALTPPGKSAADGLTLSDVLVEVEASGARIVALALAIQLQLATLIEDEADRERFINHGLYSGLLARHIFERSYGREHFVSSWKGEDVLASGILYSSGLALLGKLAPDVFRRTVQYSQTASVSLREGFYRLYGEQLAVLGASAMEAWRLPEIFTTVLRHAHRPAGLPSESTALSSVWKATLSAEQNGFAACSWPTRLIHESPGQDMMDTPDVPGMAWIGSRLTPQVAWAA